ncbi:enhanced serine sensitivity protein SseB C-terminal domain-containing protein [Streptomyces sp. JJ36]|uniref:enhanced serine sensitivity protein SseB C-terminal domain-containing protein n=1 Tax=Streptomyces sp. JJ36 TaxID=2736645 RepID=UPI001F24DDAE|nr:enhanced serine sensitivity protein SseB C-terminal domain-containing protein [Streptomyces sp. JJ36]MCF6522362.1 enhanced serine sensitivity protein SseB C-terminal domain-containing protein [Streptomyces sp. JJ36]
MSAGESVEELLRRVAPGRHDLYETYEELLRALAAGRLWMLLWHGRPGSPDAQYGNMRVAGYGYAPCVTSEQELAASGWARAHEVAGGREIAGALHRNRWGIWLNPHAPGGGMGVPWPDLRRIAIGLDRAPAGPLRIGDPSLDLPQFYALLTQCAHRTPAVRSLRRAWVQPALGSPYLAIGLDLYDTGAQAADSAARMMREAVSAVPDGLPVSSVAMADALDPVAMWLRAHARPFFDREAQAPVTQPAGPGVPPAGPGHGYGYPRTY